MILILLAAALFVEGIPSPDLRNAEPAVAEKIHKLESEVESHPKSADAWGKLCMNLHVHDFFQEAIDCYQRTISLNPNEFRWNYYQAVAVQEVNAAKAAPLFERCLKWKPGYGPLRLRYAQSLLAGGRMPEAEQQFQAAIQTKPAPADAFLGLARIQFADGETEAAKTTLLEALSEFPDRGEIHGLLSEVYRKSNQPGDAEKELALSQQLPKKIPPPDPELNPLFLEGVSSYWYEMRARALLDQREYAAAAEQLTLAIKQLPDARLYDLLGISYQYQKKYAEAVEIHRKALVLQPKSAGTMNNLATALAGAGKKQEAIDVLKQAIETEPDFVYAYWQLVRFELQTGQPKDALEYAHVACKRGGCRDASTLDILSLAYAANSDFDQAVQTARQAESLALSADVKDKIRQHLALYEKKKVPHE